MSLNDRDYMRNGSSSPGQGWRGFSAFHAVFFLNIAVFVVQFVLGEGWVHDPLSGERIMPAGGVSLFDLSQGRVWTLFTYMFVHGSPGHILVNMLMLWFAGRRVQDIYGGLRFVQIYMLSGLVGAAAELAIAAYTAGNSSAMLIGASASCFGVLMAFAVAMPREEMTALLYFVIPVRAKLRNFALFLVGANLVLGVMALADVLPDWLGGSGSGPIAYFAHLGGAAAGWYFARALGYGNARAPMPDDRFDSRVRRRRPEMVRATRRPVVELDLEAIRQQNPTGDPVVDLMRDEVDPILDKIMEQGLHSLTDEERRTLERASRQITRRGHQR